MTKEGYLKLEKEEAKHIAHELAIFLFGCYSGEKNADELVKNPENIEEEDFKDIELPWRLIEKDKNIIMALVKIYKQLDNTKN